MNNNQNGRSMTEMLGVLAIIGILSIGALLGYQYAINQYKSSNTLEEITRRNVVLAMQYTRGYDLDMSEFGDRTYLNYPITCDLKEEDYGNYSITIENVPDGVCNQIVQSEYPALIVVNDEYTNEDNIECQELNKMEFIFDEQSSWCEKIGPDGACCDNSGRCCPKSKPLLTYTGQCVSCLGERSIRLGKNIDTCARCSNREVVGEYCAEPCPSGQYQTEFGTCNTCDDKVVTFIDDTPENIAIAQACPRLVFGILNGRPRVGHCDANIQTLDVKDYPQTCGKCENRDLVKNTVCALECPSGQYRNEFGSCNTCDDKVVIFVDDNPDNIAKILACPKVVLGLSGNQYRASHCEATVQAVTVKNYPDTCNKCDNRDLVGNNVCALACSDDKYRDEYGECRSCDSKTIGFIDDTPENRQKVLNCPRVVLGLNHGRPRAEHCDVSNQSIGVKGYESECAKCDNRILSGDSCVLK